MLKRLLDILLPQGGHVVQLVEAYFDESGTHDDSPVLCVAGYIFEKGSCVMFDKEWSNVLNKFNLPYFRMSACAHHSEPFNKLTNDQCDQVARNMISIIKKWASKGIAITVEQKIYDKIVPTSPNLGSAYSCCMHQCLIAVRSWADENRYTGKIAYFFETGHKSHSETDQIITKLFNESALNYSLRYAGHSFIPKKDANGIQAADLVAWQWFTDRKRIREGLPHRKDCIALMFDGKPPHNVYHFEEPHLRAISDPVYRNKYPLTYPYPWR